MPRIGRDARLQSQAAAALQGMDARKAKSIAPEIDFLKLAFELEPGRSGLLLSGRDGRVRRWDEATDETRTFDPSGFGPFAFKSDRTALQLAWQPRSPLA